MGLKAVAAAGVKWTGLSSIVTMSLQVVQTAVLARLLSPTDFGVMAMVVIVLTFAQAVVDGGVSGALVVRRTASVEVLSSLYWFGVASGTGAFLLVVAATPIVGFLFDDAVFPQVMLLGAISLLVSAFGQQFQVLLQRELKFRAIAVADIASALSGAVCSVIVAWHGGGVYALVWGQMTSALVRLGANVLMGSRVWWPTLQFRRGDLKGFVGFGLYQMGERMVGFLASRVDQFLVGMAAGTEALGYYNIAFQLVMQPMYRINPILTRVTFPLFARLGEDVQTLRRAYLKVLGLLSVVSAPLYVGFGVVAPTVVPMFLGPGWEPVVALSQLLALVALMRSNVNPVGTLVVARDRPQWGFRWTVLVAVTQALGVYLGAVFAGALGVAWVSVGLQAIYLLAAYRVLIRPLVGRCGRQYIAVVGPPLVAASGMALAVICVGIALQASGMETLVAQMVTGVVTYGWLLWRLQGDELRDIVGLVFARRAGEPHAHRG